MAIEPKKTNITIRRDLWRKLRIYVAQNPGTTITDIVDSLVEKFLKKNEAKE